MCDIFLTGQILKCIASLTAWHMWQIRAFIDQIATAAHKLSAFKPESRKRTNINCCRRSNSCLVVGKIARTGGGVSLDRQDHRKDGTFRNLAYNFDCAAVAGNHAITGSQTETDARWFSSIERIKYFF